MSVDLMELARAAVRQSNLSLYAVAKQANLSYSRIHDLMSGRTTKARADVLGKIIAACGADVKLIWKKGR
jgi:predicted XRE-type DNA-binding protein